MDPTVSLLVSVLGLVPNVIEAIQRIRATSSETDQAAIDAAMAKYRNAALADVAKAVTDLGNAARG